jgi:hypothetical protein
MQTLILTFPPFRRMAFLTLCALVPGFGSMAADLIVNGTFDAGESGWTLGFSPGYASGGIPYAYDNGPSGNGWEVRSSSGIIFGTPTISGSTLYNGWDGGVTSGTGGSGVPNYEADLVFFLRQPFTKAGSYSAASFSFQYNIGGGASTGYEPSRGVPIEGRTLQVELLDVSQSLVATLYSFTQPAGNPPADPALTSVTLSALTALNGLSDGTYWIGFRQIVPQYFTGPGEIALDNVAFTVTQVASPVPEGGTRGAVLALAVASWVGWSRRPRP